jgi:hypothetical protein
MEMRGKVIHMASMDVDMRGIAWRKSHHSIGNGECVEVASSHDNIMVRDSANEVGTVLSYPAHAWLAFIRETKTDQTLVR